MKYFGWILLALAMSGCVEDSESAPDDPEPVDDMAVVDAAPDAAPVIDARPPRDAAPPPDARRPPPRPQNDCSDSPQVELLAEAEPEGDDFVYRTELGVADGVVRGTCGGGGPEEVLRFVPPRAGRWFFSTIRPVNQLDTVLYAITDCARPMASELACNDDSGGLQSVIAVDAQADAPLLIILDSFGRGGAVELAFGLAGAVDLGEDCDDVARACPEGSRCFRDPEMPRRRTCQEVRERGAGEPCDPQGELGPCVEGTVCYGFGGEARCEEVRERQEGERCDPRGGIGPCAVGLECRRLGDGFDDTFCVRPPVIAEGEICALDGSTGRCEDGTVCNAEGDAAPVCQVAVEACPADWPVDDLNASPGGRGWLVDGDLGMGSVEAAHCQRGGRGGPVDVYRFTSINAGRHTFETLAADGAGRIDTVLDVRRYCAFAAPESVLACDDDGGEMVLSRADVALEAEQTIYVLVGRLGLGNMGAETRYRLEVTGPGAP